MLKLPDKDADNLRAMPMHTLVHALNSLRAARETEYDPDKLAKTDDAIEYLVMLILEK